MVTIKYDDENLPYIQLATDYYIRLERQEVSDKFALIAQDELRETPENKERGLKELRELIKAETDLFVLEDEEYLVKFLRPCKYYAESAFQLMKKYYRFKVKHPKLCNGLLPSNQKETFAQGVVSFLPRRDKYGRRILFLEVGNKWKPSTVSLNDLFKIVQLSLEAAMAEPSTQVTGVVAVVDVQGLNLSHVCQFTPGFARMAVEWVQECTPIRLKGVHILNQPFVFNMVFALFKPFLAEKLRNRIFFHGTDMETLCDQVGADSLRPRYGGKMDVPDPDGSFLGDLLVHYDDEFALANTLGYNKNVK